MFFCRENRRTLLVLLTLCVGITTTAYFAASPLTAAWCGTLSAIMLVAVLCCMLLKHRQLRCV